jgi:hypothetical protein
MPESMVKPCNNPPMDREKRKKISDELKGSYTTHQPALQIGEG